MKSGQNLMVGAFVLSALGILLFGVYFLKGTSPGSKTDDYFVLFEGVSTLQNGDPVKVNGVKAGKVKGIELDGAQVRVTLEVSRGIRLPKDSEIRIQNIGLMGERQIGVQLGRSSEMATPGARLEGSLDAGIAEAMGTAGAVFIESEKLVKTLRSVVDSTLGRDDFVDRFNGLLLTADTLSRRLNHLIQEAEPRVRRSVVALEAAGTGVAALVESQEAPLKELIQNGVEASERAKVLLERADRVAAELETILALAGSPEGTVGALLRDSTLHRDLRSALLSADSLFKTIDKRGLDVNLDLF
jgi:phospholipid/cholesterol/gamma-HCH transport system substrate-binding protein